MEKEAKLQLMVILCLEKIVLLVLVLVYTQEGSLWSIVLRCDDHTGIFTCDGWARDPYFYVPAETQSYVIKLSCSPYLGIGGGVLLYVSEDLKAESVPVLNSHDFEDSIWCKVRISPSKTLYDC